MNSVNDIISSIAKASFQLRSLLMLIVAGLAFHVHAVRITNGSPLAHRELLARSAQSPVVVICAFATVVVLIVAGAVASTGVWRLWRLLPFHKVPPTPQVEDYVPLSLARKLALLERDTLWIDRTEKQEAARQRSLRHKERNEWLLFALLVLFVVDLRCPESATAIVTREMGLEGLPALLWVVCVFVGGAWCALVLWDDPMLDWIEHPELAVKRGSEFRPSAIAAQAFRRSMPPTMHTPHRSS
jgi:hypothetical protein